jgi:signal transduction histidine kinase
MRLKTFGATYLLFLFVLFASLSIVSVHLNNSQTNMLQRQSQRDFQRISATFVRDIAVSYGASANIPDFDFRSHVEQLALDYARYYRRHNIDISLMDLSRTQHGSMEQQHEVQMNENNVRTADGNASFVQREQEHFVRIAGTLPEPFEFYLLIYYLDITENITNMQNIQSVLLIFFIVFSAIAALALYFILLRIFKPLDIIAVASRKIADEHYHERIHIKGNNELAIVAEDFNRMAEKIENQIRLLEEESANKQRFIDNFAHEIRTPLTAVFGNAEYMQKAVLDEGEMVGLTQSIMDKTEQMTDIADSLLKLATLRNYSPVKSEIDLTRLFDDISQTLSKSMNERGIWFTCKSNVDVLMGQEDLIKSLLLNLCLNGLKACSAMTYGYTASEAGEMYVSNDAGEASDHPGSGIVSLKAKQQNGNIVLAVSDNGAGIPADSLQRVTEPFYRVDKARNRNHGGAGLGLTLCKQIADVHGAEMMIESTVGMGTTVRVMFGVESFTTS